MKPVFWKTAFRTLLKSLPFSVLPTPSTTENVMTWDLATISCGGSISPFVSSSRSSESSRSKRLRRTPLLGHAGTLTGADMRNLPEPEPVESPELDPDRGIGTGGIVLAADVAENEGSRPDWRRRRVGRSSDKTEDRPNLAGWNLSRRLDRGLESVDGDGDGEFGPAESGDQTTSDSSNSSGFESELGCLSCLKNRFVGEDEWKFMALWNSYFLSYFPLSEIFERNGVW